MGQGCRHAGARCQRSSHATGSGVGFAQAAGLGRAEQQPGGIFTPSWRRQCPPCPAAVHPRPPHSAVCWGCSRPASDLYMSKHSLVVAVMCVRATRTWSGAVTCGHNDAGWASTSLLGTRLAEQGDPRTPLPTEAQPVSSEEGRVPPLDAPCCTTDVSPVHVCLCARVCLSVRAAATAGSRLGTNRRVAPPLIYSSHGHL